MFLAINLWARREFRVAALIKCESWLHRSNSTLLHADTRATKPCRDSPLKEACNLPVEEKDGYNCIVCAGKVLYGIFAVAPIIMIAGGLTEISLRRIESGMCK